MLPCVLFWCEQSNLNSTLSDADPNVFCKICDMQSVSLVSDEKGSPPDNHPVFIQSCTGTAGGSNPTPGAFSSTPCIDSR